MTAPRLGFSAHHRDAMLFRQLDEASEARVARTQRDPEVDVAFGRVRRVVRGPRMHLVEPELRGRGHHADDLAVDVGTRGCGVTKTRRGCAAANVSCTLGNRGGLSHPEVGGGRMTKVDAPIRDSFGDSYSRLAAFIRF